ncbi:MAG: hypothetical protein Kow0065_02290 [Methylomicrobium sp.]
MMTDTNEQSVTKENEDRPVKPPLKGDVLAKSIVTGVAVSSINHTGRSLLGNLIKHPWLVFGFGLTAGYFIGKYRKEIIGLAEQAGDQGKSFVLKQRENLLDLIAESQESSDDRNT